MTQQKKLIITGIAASGGISKGKVKIVTGVKDIPDFMEGQILVSEMTEPSMVIMMNKASAIITDRGGITCHAAIVSRELGIPCVVGTKQGTNLLKDGMNVLVDGSQGKVFQLE